MRSEGLTELLGEIVFTCTGGTLGQKLPADFFVSLNASITSKVLANGKLDALLLVNDPTPTQQILDQTIFTAEYAEAPTGGLNRRIAFRNVPVQFTSSGTATIRIQNIRFDAWSVLLNEKSEPRQVIAQLAWQIGGSWEYSKYEQKTYAVLQTGLSSSLSNARGDGSTAVLPGCSGQNLGLLSSNLGLAPPSFQVKFTEGFSTAFAPRLGSDENGEPIQHNQPKSFYYAESGFHNPNLPGLERVGLADSGTRLLARFHNIPAGMRVFVTVSPIPSSQPLALSATLIATEEGRGEYRPITPMASTTINGQLIGIAPLEVTNGFALAAWEVQGRSPSWFTTDTLAFGVVAAYAGNTLPVTNMQIDLELAPVGLGNTTTGPPLFVRSGRTHSVLSEPCNGLGPDLSTSITGPATATVGESITLVTQVRNQGVKATRVNGIEYYVADRNSTFSTNISYSLCSYNLGELAPGGTITCTDTIRVPDTINPGRYDFIAIVDPNRLSSDSNLENNASRYPLEIVTPPCHVNLQYKNALISATYGGKVAISVTSSNCRWTARANAAWIKVLSDGYTTGNGSSTVDVSLNLTGSPRSAVVTIGNSSVTIQQSGVLSRMDTTAIAPAASRRASETFTFAFARNDEWEPTSIIVDFKPVGNSARLCQVVYGNSSGVDTIALYDSVGPNPTIGVPSIIGVGSLILGGRNCSLSMVGVSVARKGFTTQLTLPVTMLTNLGVKQNISVTALYGEQLKSPELVVGAWWPGAATGTPVSRYRLFGTVTRSHLHTTDLNEYTVLGATGIWRQEGITGQLLNAPGAHQGVAAVPLYRIYKQQSRSHFWTTDQNEYLTLIGLDGIYTGEGVDGLVLPSAAPGTVPLYRLAHQFEVPVLHHWTTDANEYNVLAERGWRQEGIAGYLIKAP